MNQANLTASYTNSRLEDQSYSFAFMLENHFASSFCFSYYHPGHWTKVLKEPRTIYNKESMEKFIDEVETELPSVLFKRFAYISVSVWLHAPIVRESSELKLSFRLCVCGTSMLYLVTLLVVKCTIFFLGLKTHLGNTKGS